MRQTAECQAATKLPSFLCPYNLDKVGNYFAD